MASETNAIQPVWGLGFRPFFLLGALAGTGLLGLWLYVLAGHPLARIGPGWHAHEMLFGFAAAVLAGFLLTATQNWTGIRGVHGSRLMLLSGLWAAGRLAMLAPWPMLAAGLDLLFLPALLLSLWPYLSAAKQKRNRVFLLLFALQIGGNLLYHLESLAMAGTGRQGLYLALHVYLLMIIVIGGRVIPAFTRNAISEARLRSWPWLERGGLLLAGSWLLADLIWPASGVTRWLALALAAAQGLRWLGWFPWQTRRNPLLWILPLGYAWLILGFLLSGLPAPFAPPVSVATHAFTTGAIGVMMYGMLTRVGLGHTGRSLAASKRMIAGYVLVNLAATIRVGVPWLLPAWTLPGLLWAGLLWSLAFGLYLWEYAPFLLAPRPDGKPG